MQRIATDIGSYYEAAYVPVMPGFDGRFRKIAVKVTRPGRHRPEPHRVLRAAAWRGLGTAALRDAAADRADRGPPPHAFDYQAACAAVRPDAGRPRARADLRGAAARYDVSRRTAGEEAYALRFSLLALVRDHEGRIVERFSDNYPFEGPLENLAA